MSGRILDMQTRIYNLLNAWFPEPAAGGEPVGNILDTETAIYELLSARFEQMPGDIADAVMTYLEEHPTALDQAAIEAIFDERLDGIEEDVGGLKSALQEFALVTDVTDNAYSHNVTPKTISFYPDECVQDEPCRYVGSENLVEGKYESGQQAGFTKTISERFLMISGTGSSSGVRFINTTDSATLAKLRGKTVNIYLYIKKSTNWEKASYIQIYDGKSNTIRLDFSVNSDDYIGFTSIANITISSEATIFRIKIDDSSSDVFADGDLVWIGVYESAVVNTEHVIDGENPYTIDVQGINYVDTILHKSTATHIVPTKTYVDEHTPDIIGYWNDNVYAMPEKFGAVGDGVTDDAQALTNCIAYAVSTGKPVRGYRKYKTSVPIALSAQYMDVYFKEIIYTGNADAVQLQNESIRFEFGTITSNAVGINFMKNPTANKYARQCQVNGNKISSYSHCIETQDLTMYCTVEIRYLVSANGDCIHYNKSSPENYGGVEFIYRSSSCACPNGYAIYECSSCKFYDFTIEGNCKYGLYNPLNCECIGFRHREQTDRMIGRIKGNTDYNNGPLITFTTNINTGGNGFVYITADGMPWCSVDVSQAEIGYDTQIDLLTYLTIAYNGIYVQCPIRGSGIFDAYYSGYNVIGDKMCFVGNMKVYAPQMRSDLSITTSTYDYRVFDSMNDTDIISASALRFATDFIIDENTTIYLSNTFGAIGYNDLTVTQHNGKTVVIYDKMGNILFDGTNLGNGKWHLVCIADRSTLGTRYLDQDLQRWVYDGTNEKWETTKIS